MATPPKSPPTRQGGRSTPPKSPPTSQGGLENAAGEGRMFAVLAYVAPVIGGLLGLALDGDNPLTRVHARQSISTVLALIITFFVWAAVGYLLSLIPIAGPIVAIALFSLVIAMAAFLAANWVVSFLMALRGEERTIPFANRVALRLFHDGGGAEAQSA